MKNGVNNVASSENATTANVETASSVPSSAGAAARRNSGQSTSSTTSTKATDGNIRMVKMYHVATPPEEYPEQFELQSENGSESWWSARVVTMRMDDEEEDDWVRPGRVTTSTNGTPTTSTWSPWRRRMWIGTTSEQSRWIPSS